MQDREWLHFDQAPSHREGAAGERRLSVATADDGVVFVVVKNGRPTSCTISFDDWELLQHFVELERPLNGKPGPPSEVGEASTRQI
jgi:hypothetical protein